MKQLESAANREKIIVRTGVIGVSANLFLSAFKALIGILANSISVILDAVNNLSDAIASVITIAGTKLAGRAPDKKHPLGHGRIEYMTALVVSALVLYAGVTALVESVKKIIEPVEPNYSLLSFIVIGAAIVVKILLGVYVQRVGKRVESASLIASGADAAFDAILSASVLATALIYFFTGVSLEAYVGVLISAFIIKSGIGMMRETLGDILGRRTDKEVSAAIKETLCAEPDVHGAFDLFLYDYGPNKKYGSVHVEVNDTLTASDIDALCRRLEYAVYHENGVILTGIGIYSINTRNDEIGAMRRAILECVMKEDAVKQFHGFYADPEKKYATFDVVLSFECDREATVRLLCEKVGALYPDYSFVIQPDIDITD